jgi:hypothetical protein
MADLKRAYCPKCEAEGRSRCTRFHMVTVAGKAFIRCERKECGWTGELAETPVWRKEG